MSNIYLKEFKHVAKQAYSMWNREPASPSFGSFDRTYWGWKYKDFSDATRQYAVKLAVEYAQLIGQTSTLPALLEGYVVYCQKIQLKDGSFNQAYPNEKTPGVIYDILSTLIYVRQSPYLTSIKAQQDLDGIIERAVDFVLRVDEKHGEIANHIAEYAYELLYYAHYAQNERAKRKGEDYIARLLSLFNYSEGWFQEYYGPDPGYQTRTLRYLIKCALLPNLSELWPVVYKATDFVETLLMPDGSIHPMLGTRSTALVYPSAFEILAARDQSYKELAMRVWAGWQNGCVPLPSWLDFDNAIRLADDAKDAAEAMHSVKVGESNISDRTRSYFGPTYKQISLDLPQAGIAIRCDQNYVLYVGYKMGGVVVVYSLQNDKWRLLYEDSGYLIRSMDLKTRWLSRMPDTGRLVETNPNGLLIQTEFYQSLHDEVTSLRLVLLRVLNMTLLRVQWIGDLFRKFVVRYLMTGRHKVSLELTREIIVKDGKIHIGDLISGQGSRLGRLFRCRRIIGTHMASSRYFQQQELDCLPLDWFQEINWTEKNVTRHEIILDVSYDGG